MNACQGRVEGMRTTPLLCWVSVLSLLVPHTLFAETYRYQASMHEAEWQMESSVFECRLYQPIPGYGEAQFLHPAGEQLMFSMEAYADTIHSENLFFRSEPPPWNFKREPSQILQLGEVVNPNKLVLGSDDARKLISEMLLGMVPTLVGQSVISPGQQIDIGLSPLHFKAAYSSYQTCAEDLLPVNYSQVGRSTIFWPSGARQLSAETMQLLDNIVLYSKADRSVVGFEVDSFTDTAGETRENLLLSEERAFLVTNYLIRQGVDPETIATRAHGEREQFLVVNPERSAADRDRNRRVNVVMVRR